MNLNGMQKSNGIQYCVLVLMTLLVGSGCEALRLPSSSNQQLVFGDGRPAQSQVQSQPQVQPQPQPQVQAKSASYQPTQTITNPAQARLIQTLNARAAAIKQLDCPVTIKVPGAPKIRGSLQVEFPLRMRLKAGVLGVSELGVDAGSNDQQFWVWSKMDLPGSPAALYFANHREFQTSRARQQIPLEPRQLINALGLVSLDPAGKHYGPFPVGKKHLQLFSVLENNGARETRVILINAKTGSVEQTSMYDRQNRLIAYANAINFKNYDRFGIALPSKVELHVIQPGQDDFVLKVDLGSFTINSLFGDPNQLWGIPQPNNVQRVNLGAN